MTNKWRNDMMDAMNEAWRRLSPEIKEKLQQTVDVAEIKSHHPTLDGLRADVVIMDELSHYKTHTHQRRSGKNMTLGQILTMVAPTEKVTLRKGRDGEEWDCTPHHASKYASHRVTRIEAEEAKRIIIEVEELPASPLNAGCVP